MDRRFGVPWAALPAGHLPDLSLSLQPPRSRNQRNNSLPLPSASDTVETEGLVVQPSPRCGVSGTPRRPKNPWTRGPQEDSLNKEAWALRSPIAYTGALRSSWDKVVDRGYDWSERVAPPGQGSRSEIPPSLRRPSLGDSSAEDGWQEWAREPSAGSRWGTKTHSRGLAWADV